MKVKKVEGFDFRFILEDDFGEMQGIIDASFDTKKEFIVITYFCVAQLYRNSDMNYGQKLLEALVKEVKTNTKITKIKVTPIPHEEFDDNAPMGKEMLIKIYQKLGFEAIENEKEMEKRI